MHLLDIFFHTICNPTTGLSSSWHGFQVLQTFFWDSASDLVNGETTEVTELTVMFMERVLDNLCFVIWFINMPKDAIKGGGGDTKG